MPGEDIQSWSKTANNNGNADGLIDWQEHQARKSVNNSARSMMAAHAKNRDLLNGTIVTTGTINAQAFLSGVTYTAMPPSLVVKLKVGAGLTNTGVMTLNMDGLGDVEVKNPDGASLQGGEFKENRYVDLIWNGTNWIYSYSAGNFAELDSPVFVGDPQAPTAPPGDADNSIATTAFVQDAIYGGHGIVLGVKVFDTAGTFTYTPTPGMKSCIIECVGGGGGAGSSACSPGNLMGGGGGGSGGYSRKFATADQIGTSQTVVVGFGGSGGGAPGGFPGNQSLVGSLCLANGGYGGASTINGDIVPTGGAGAIPGIGDIVAAGSPGEQGEYSLGFAGAIIGGGGRGGSSYFGGGAQIPAVGSTGSGLGVNAGNYGSGGSGAISHQTSGFIQTGNGSAGIVIITEFSGAGQPGATGPIGPAGPQGIPGPPGGLGEAPNDGQLYGRQSAAWSPMTGGGGGAFTTGDAKLTLKTTADTGWVIMNDGTIGSASSGASTRANVDCQALFTLLYSNINDLNAPVLTSAGVTSNRATQGTAAAAWAANCRMTLTRQLGRTLGIAGAGSGLTSRALGGFLGEEAHTLTTAELAVHNHAVTDPTHLHTLGPGTVGNYTGAWDGVAGGTFGMNAASSTTSSTTLAAGTGVTIQNAGSGAAHNIMQPTSFWNIMIKL